MYEEGDGWIEEMDEEEMDKEEMYEGGDV